MKYLDRKRKEREKLNKKYESLNLQELNDYESIVERNSESNSWLIWFPIKIFLYAGILSIICNLAFAIDVSEEMLIIGATFISLYPAFILTFMIFGIIDYLKIIKLKRKLLR